jgi:hypothetical protein
MNGIKVLVTGIAIIFVTAIQAQVSVSVNIGSPPMWGPAGYPSVQYYYLPDVEAYYDVRSSMFIYYGGGAWVHRAYLPARYKTYDLYSGYKVVMTDYHGTAPYSHFKEHKKKYAKGYHGSAQKTIGERPGKGNSGGKIYYDDKHEKKDGGNKSENSGHGNDKGGGKGNKK